jgi:uncharacterized protein (TIGR02145 family)
MKKIILIYPGTVAVLVLLLTTDCKKEEPATLAVLSTTPVTNITTITATSGGNISFNGGAEILANGVCWSTTENPTVEDSKTVNTVSSGQFVSSLSGLTAGTTYHVRAYATNSEGTDYGADIIFTTYSGSVSDVEGNRNYTIRIGAQVWMAENLKTDRYSNGDLINTTNPAYLDITAEATPKYQWAYDGNEKYVATYGRLYTWYAVTDSRNVCPTGWHVPTDAEWTTLTNYLGGENVAGDKLKEKGTTHWQSPYVVYTGGTNETGFTALPGGSRYYYGSPPTFIDIDNGDLRYFCTWWSSTEYSVTNASIRSMSYESSNLFSNNADKHGGFSVRCLQD